MSERYDQEYVRREQQTGPEPYRDPRDPAANPDPRYPPRYVGPGQTGYEQRSSYSEVRVRTGPNYQAIRIVWFIVGLIDALLIIRFLLRLLGASIGADFVRFIYGITQPLIAPFRGIFNTSGSGSYVFEPESLVAIIVYTLIGWGIATLIRILTSPRTPAAP